MIPGLEDVKWWEGKLLRNAAHVERTLSSVDDSFLARVSVSGDDTPKHIVTCIARLHRGGVEVMGMWLPIDNVVWWAALPQGPIE